jgi:hypothetical protein
MWENLTTEQKEQYKVYCENKFGKTVVFSEKGEPLYFNESCYMIQTNVIIDLLFPINLN